MLQSALNRTLLLFTTQVKVTLKGIRLHIILWEILWPYHHIWESLHSNATLCENLCQAKSAMLQWTAMNKLKHNSHPYWAVEIKSFMVENRELTVQKKKNWTGLPTEDSFILGSAYFLNIQEHMNKCVLFVWIMLYVVSTYK